MGDNVSKNVGGKVWSGKVLTINKNLLEVQWDGAGTKQWINADLVERKIATISQVSLIKLIRYFLYSTLFVLYIPASLCDTYQLVWGGATVRLVFI